MNDNLNTPSKEDLVEAHKTMDEFEKLTDEQFEAFLAAKPDGTPEGIFVTDADEVEADEPTPTLH